MTRIESFSYQQLTDSFFDSMFLSTPCDFTSLRSNFSYYNSYTKKGVEDLVFISVWIEALYFIVL